MEPTQRVLELAREAGFDLAGIAPLGPPRDAERFRTWLAQGRHGGMDWMERGAACTTDPRRLLEGGRSILVVGLAHSRPAFALGDGARVARYAAGRDYHNVVGKRLRSLARRLRAEGLAGEWRKAVDATPLLERSHAAEAGLGFLSKAANLLHPAFGPWFFLGELLLDAELEPTADAPAGSCGTCTACIDVCPTGAIHAPGAVDARDCLSYLTIEHSGPIPAERRGDLGPWAFGCDLCSEVCPFGRDAPDLGERFGVHRALAEDAESAGAGGGGLVSWIEIGEEELDARFGGSALRRPGREGLARNAAIVLGNRPTDGGRRTLLRALSFDPSAVVRGAAAWALGRGHGADAGVHAALDRAARGDSESAVQREARAALDGA